MGLTYRAIAQALGISSRQAQRDITKALEESSCENDGALDQQMRLDLARIDFAMAALAPKVREGDGMAISRWLRACDVRRRLLRFGRGDHGPQQFQIKFIDSSALPDDES
jgi:hypothetical protein